MRVEAEVLLAGVRKEMPPHWKRALGTRVVVWRCYLLGDPVSF